MTAWLLVIIGVICIGWACRQIHRAIVSGALDKWLIDDDMREE